MSKVDICATIIKHSADIGLTKYGPKEVVTAWNMTHPFWLDVSGEVSINAAKRLESFCDFIKSYESLPLKEIAKQYCLKNHVPFITEDRKKVYLKLMTGSGNKQKRTSKLLAEAKEIIKRMLPLMPSGFNDMGNCDFIWDTKRKAEQFLKEVEE